MQKNLSLTIYYSQNTSILNLLWTLLKLTGNFHQKLQTGILACKCFRWFRHIVIHNQVRLLDLSVWGVTIATFSYVRASTKIVQY